MVVLVIIFTDFCVVFLDFVFLFDIFHLFIDSAFRLICSLPLSLLPLTIPANYRLSSQFFVSGFKSRCTCLVNAKIFVCNGLEMYDMVCIGKFDFNCSMPQQFDIILIRDIDYLSALLCTCRDKRKHTQYPVFLMMR